MSKLTLEEECVAAGHTVNILYEDLKESWPDRMADTVLQLRERIKWYGEQLAFYKREEISSTPSDYIPALLSPGEYYLPPKMVAMLQKMNTVDKPKEHPLVEEARIREFLKEFDLKHEKELQGKYPHFDYIPKEHHIPILEELANEPPQMV